MTNILTLRLDPAAQTHFDALRRLHFPPERNLIPAHLTLFHSLPDEPRIDAALALAAAKTPTFTLAVTGLRSLGKGVAYTLHAPELVALHRTLAQAFAAHLTPQDGQPFRPHVVVQNKTTPEAARTLLADLQRTFSPTTAQAVGLDLWHYLGGPWQHARHFPFMTQP